MAYYVGNQQVSSLDYDKKKKQEQAEAARKRAMDDYKKANTKVTPTVGTAQKQSSSKTNGVSWLPEATITPIQNYPDYGSRPTYTPSSALNNAAAQLAQYENNKPGAYQSKYQDQIAGLLDKILNREKFSYDAMSDPLYRQYKDSYTQQGKLAMQDAMGDAAALTGGYGSSYGQTVGQQVYQQNLQKINDKIPELYNAAYGRYADEGNKMTNDLGILQGLDESDYGRHRDTVSDYYNELQYFYTKYNDMSNQELQRYMNDQDAWESDRAYWYQREQDAQSQSNWQAEFDLAKQKAQGSGSSSVKQSAAYKDVTASIKNMDKDTAERYINAQVDAGYITADEGIYIYTTLLPAVKGETASTSTFGDAVPRTYREFVDATGYGGILTEDEFRRYGKSSAYTNYQDYLKNMYEKHK